MPAFICITCGTQYAATDRPPAACPICNDERQHVPPTGQAWTTLEALVQRSYNAWRELEPNLLSVSTFPPFGIGQRALFVRTPHGNILWDCVSLIDDATVTLIKALGGVTCIAISHPHYYTTMVEWSRALGEVPVYLHAGDRKWIMRSDPAIEIWTGDTRPLLPGLTLINVGGHYPGGTVLHWSEGAGGKGALLSGDLVQVAQDNKSVSFMWSFANYIPLSGPRVQGVVDALKPYAFERIHGAFNDRTIWVDGKDVLERSAARYLKIIRGDGTYELA